MTATTHAPAELLDEPVGEPISLHHFVRTLRNYRRVILLSLVAIAVAYLLFAVVIYVMSPTQRVTTQPFRLDFEGAANGKFPNGLRFSTTDIISPSILLPVYAENDLKTYVTFPNFSRSLFVLEANAAYDRLAAEYVARLSDPRLAPLDRERLQREYEQKRDAIAKNEYSLNYVRFEALRAIPEPIVRKVLADTLARWSDFAIKDQDVLAYKVAVLSPEILAPTEIEKTDPMIATHMLRARTVRLLDNLAVLQKLPGAELARAGSNRMSLEEVRLRMQEIQRYQIEPLVSRIRASGIATPVTLHFLQDQLDYDQRQLAAAKRQSDSVRDTLAMYEQSVSGGAQPVRTSAQSGENRGSSGETVMPQLSDTFIDRLGDLVRKSADAQFRQQIATDYRTSLESVIPLEQAVAYDTMLLVDVKKGVAGGARVDPASITSEVEASRNELKVLVGRMNEIYREISRSVYSTSQLVTVTAPPWTRTTHAIDGTKLMLWGVAVMLLSLPLIVIACVLHNRVREEEAQEQRLSSVPS
jgi:hypothetical protein